jgi:hypothetical protein
MSSRCARRKRRAKHEDAEVAAGISRQAEEAREEMNWDALSIFERRARTRKLEAVNEAAGDFEGMLRSLTELHQIEITAHNEAASDMLAKRIVNLREALKDLNGDEDMRRVLL